MKPKIYRLRHSDWEVEHVFDFIHNDNKSDDEFKLDIQTIMKKYSDEYLKKEKGWVGTYDIIRFIAPKIKELGYEEIYPTTEYRFQGGSIIRKDFMSNNNLLDDEKEIINVMGEEFIKKCIKKNDKFEVELYKFNDEINKNSKSR